MYIILQRYYCIVGARRSWVSGYKGRYKVQGTRYKEVYRNRHVLMLLIITCIPPWLARHHHHHDDTGYRDVAADYAMCDVQCATTSVHMYICT
ncbi:hypothetical protein K504DRAFT_39845 [Pleomassaria siparia CBS 279.74]|uniref:Uncharacterized protein n=1 Tax=Pleomassaria siparia CBS 279.74 TaxID=1314801 RepID=A0A6G1K484_9PLEO|nr:hypothetical protein K504DRAFT_39845 [Pleomassaria siparia CBS 279.74]